MHHFCTETQKKHDKSNNLQIAMMHPKGNCLMKFALVGQSLQQVFSDHLQHVLPHDGDVNSKCF